MEDNINRDLGESIVGRVKAKLRDVYDLPPLARNEE
jgi:hypothetical protein